MPDDREKFSLSEMVAEFDVQRISLGGPIFDTEKLAWLSGRWIREDLSLQEYADRVRQWALNSDYLLRIAPLTQQRVERLSDLEPLTGFFFRGVLDPSPEALVVGKLDRERILQLFDAVIARVDPVMEWNRDVAHAVVSGAAEEFGIKLRDALKPLYVALTGKPAGVPLFDAMDILGKDLCRARIRQARTTLVAAPKGSNL
jgi:glutamyl-tRNA synthetase